ncbi:nuclear transport factor 2 family protein [Pelagibaculum spongiae]|uniref:SnoaL-like domain-containing protein n=1 Tax=Pelagibaculum spongiae TaxID=2080658 RepID=A0A2V1GZQ7_9GAMM|nr:nuclear transport factor 2 family protein [Pelagibaculum spongiae]PVZ68811.1 hypothetical protein DC094_11170 [Pelagibaculum spongiae]
MLAGILFRRVSLSFLTTILVFGVMASNTAMAEGSLTSADVSRYYQALSTHQIDLVGSFYDQNITYEDVATGESTKGNAAAIAFVKKFLEATPGVKVETQKVVVAANFATVEWLMSAGKGKNAWNVRGVSVIEHSNGKMTRVSDYWNN